MIEVEITDDDISKGQGLSKSLSPIALALKRKFNTNDVNIITFIGKYKSTYHHIKVNNKTYTKNEIINYDEFYSFVTRYDMCYKNNKNLVKPIILKLND